MRIKTNTWCVWQSLYGYLGDSDFANAHKTVSFVIGN